MGDPPPRDHPGGIPQGGSPGGDPRGDRTIVSLPSGDRIMRVRTTALEGFLPYAFSCEGGVGEGRGVEIFGSRTESQHQLRAKDVICRPSPSGSGTLLLFHLAAGKL